MSINRKDESLGSSDFELLERMGRDLVSLMAKGISESEFRVLLTSALGVISNMSSFKTMQHLLNPENFVPKTGMLTAEQVMNLFKHLSSLSINLSATQKPLRSTEPKIAHDEKTVRFPLNKAEIQSAEQLFSQANMQYMCENFWPAKELVEAALAKNSKVAKYHFLHGLCCSHHQRFLKQAGDSFTAAVELEPAKPEYRIALIDFYRKNGLLLRAIRECERAAVAVPADKRIQHLLRELKTKGLG